MIDWRQCRQIDTSQLTPSPSNVSAARSVSVTIAPQVTIVTSVPSRRRVTDIERECLPVVRDFLFHQAVHAGGLEEDYRVGITDRRKQQPVGARG